MIEYVPTPLLSTTALTPWDPSTQCKGLGSILGTIVGVVATIAVPFLAPVIGSALGGGFFASIAGQALIGAGIGAIGGGVGAAVSGSSILQGALLGGAGGGIAGGAGAFFGGAGLTTGAGATAGAGAGPGAGSSFFYGTPGTLTGDAGLAGSGAFYGSAGTVPTAGLTPPTAGVGATSAVANPTSTAPAAGAVPGGVAATTATGGLATAFKTAAIQSVMAGGMQALKTLTSEQQGALLNQMKQEMAVTQGQDAAAYQAQLKIFNDYYSYAKSINPEYFSQLERNNESQRLAQVANAGERQLRATGYGAPTIGAERRRNEVEGVAGLNTAGTTGYMRGLQAKDAAYQTSSSLYPKSQPTHTYDIQNMYNDETARSEDQTAGIAGIIAPWQIYAQHRLGVLDNSRTT